MAGTPIRDLLHMSTGVDFREERDGGRGSQSPVARTGHRGLDLQEGYGGQYHAIQSSDRASGEEALLCRIEPDLLGVVLHYTINRSASEYLREKVWQPRGAEADPHGFWTQKVLNWHISGLVPCCAITRGLDASSLMTAHGRTGRSYLRNG